MQWAGLGYACGCVVSFLMQVAGMLLHVAVLGNCRHAHDASSVLPTTRLHCMPMLGLHPAHTYILQSLHRYSCRVHLWNENGRPTGMALVEFPTPQLATVALQKNKAIMGTRYIELFPATRGDLEKYSSKNPPLI